MAMNNKPRGVTKAQWLEAALKVLENGNVTDVTVEGLARELGIARAGFYWHFRNRQDLLDQVLDYWIHETTEIVSKNPLMMELEPGERLVKTAEMIHDYELGRYDLAIRQWARCDRDASRKVGKVDKMRQDFIRNAFSEAGFRDDELEMRTMLFVCYQSMEQVVFRTVSRKRRRSLIEKRVNLLMKK